LSFLRIPEKSPIQYEHGEIDMISIILPILIYAGSWCVQKRLAAFLCLTIIVAAPAYSTAQTHDYTDLSLEDLMDIEITSVSKRSQKISEAAAAVFVITNKDIQRSGAASIPEILRMAPGIHVARIDANKWAVTSRGFNGRFANKLLVLIDGRSVYTPLFSGVFWDVQDTLIDDIDRIEIIRGPGASLWGANAVNGVINIITKKASETNGGLFCAGIGTEDKHFGNIRYGAKLNAETDYRIFAKYFNRDYSLDSQGHKAEDKWDSLRAGFRMDWQSTDNESVTIQGDIYNNHSGDTITISTIAPPYSNVTDEDNISKGGNILARWKIQNPASSSMSVQIYYDSAEFKTEFLGSKYDTLDIDFSHLFSLSDSHKLMWGLGYRFIHENNKNSFYSSMHPDVLNDKILSAFIQGDTTLMDDSLCITMGSKFERNDYTGFEIQPNIRAIWSPRMDQAVWASISRAVRTPSHSETYGELKRYVYPPERLGTSLPVAITMMGDKNFESEVVIAYEIGYRIRPAQRLSLDIATFYNDYERLLSGEPGPLIYSPLLPYIIFPFKANNKMSGITYGVELSADWDMLDWWRFQASYTRLMLDYKMDSNSFDFASESFEEETPHHLFSLRSSMDLPHDLELDLWLRFVDKLPGQHVDSYTTLDLRLGWKPTQNMELSLVGQNLLERKHAEFRQEVLEVQQTEIERSVYGKIKYTF